MRRRDEVIISLYDAHYEALLRIAYLLVGANEADDLVQEAFLRALDRWRPDGSQEAFRAWAKTTMVRVAISRWRSSKRERAALHRHGGDVPADPPSVVPEISQALRALTPRQRTAVVLRYYEDLPDREIATLMGVRVGTVKALLSQARSRLRLDPTLIAS